MVARVGVAHLPQALIRQSTTTRKPPTGIRERRRLGTATVRQSVFGIQGLPLSTLKQISRRATNIPWNNCFDGRARGFGRHREERVTASLDPVAIQSECSNGESASIEEIVFLVRLVPRDHCEQLLGGNDPRRAVRFWEMTQVPRDEIRRFSRRRAFEKPVVRFVLGDGECLGWSNVERERGKVRPIRVCGRYGDQARADRARAGIQRARRPRRRE